MKFKRNYSKKKRSYRKRSFKRGGYKKRYAKKVNKYDGSVGVKIHQTVYCSIYQGMCDTQIAWFGTPITSDAHTAYPSDLFSDVEMNDFCSRYSYFKPVGLKMEYIPTYPFAYLPASSGAMSSVEQLYYASDLNVGLDRTTAMAAMQRKPDYKSYNPRASFKRYINLSKVLKQNYVSWIKTAQAASALIPQQQNTLFRINTYGLPDGEIMGSVHLTYYFKFKGYDY